jgi:ACS family tartrate transporter-like MFS transporter
MRNEYGPTRRWSLIPAQEPELGASVVRKISRRLLPFLFLLYIVAYVDRINVGFAALQMQTQLHFSDAVYGFGAGIFFAGYFLFQVPSNLALYRVGARRWLTLLMIAWGLVSSTMMLVHTPRSFYTARFLLGVAEAGFFPGVILYMKNWFPAAVRARTVALFMTAGPLAGVVGGPISGALLGLHQKGGLAGWQWLFLMEGAPAIVLGVICYFFLTDRPADAQWLGTDERAWLADVLNRELESVHAVSRTNTLAAFSNGKVWLLAGVSLGLNTCSYGISLWLPSVIHSLSGVNNFVIGLLSVIPYLSAAVIMVLVGSNSDRTGERRWHIAMPALVGGVALLIAGPSTSVAPVIFAMTLGMVGVSSMMGPFWALSTSLLAESAAAAGIAFINCVGNLGGFFGPYIVGLVRTLTGGFKGGLLSIGAALTMSGFLVLLVRVRNAREKV